MIGSGQQQVRFGRGSVAAGLAIALVCWVFPLEAEAQQEVGVTLGADLTIPGGESYLPLMFYASGVSVGKVSSEISFPKSILSFAESKRGEAAEQAGAEIKTEVKNDSKNSEFSILKIEVSAAKELPGGVLATLKFQVSKSAPEGIIKIKNVVKALTLSGEEIKDVKGNEAELTISPPKLPEVSCFFFTH